MKHPAGPPASTLESARMPPPARSFFGSTTPRALRPATAADTLLISTTSPGFQTPPKRKDGRVELVNSSRDKENGGAGMGETAPEVDHEGGGVCSICLSPLKNSGSNRRQEQREVYTVRLCKHNFHRACLVVNRGAGNVGCPCCRGPLEPGLTPEATAEEREQMARTSAISRRREEEEEEEALQTRARRAAGAVVAEAHPVPTATAALLTRLEELNAAAGTPTTRAETRSVAEAGPVSVAALLGRLEELEVAARTPTRPEAGQLEVRPTAARLTAAAAAAAAAAAGAGARGAMSESESEAGEEEARRRAEAMTASLAEARWAAMAAMAEATTRVAESESDLSVAAAAVRRARQAAAAAPSESSSEFDGVVERARPSEANRRAAALRLALAEMSAAEIALETARARKEAVELEAAQAASRALAGAAAAAATAATAATAAAAETAV
ncbi:unnamed protein product [Ectocarpus sp. 8 AP-2014]